MLLIDKQSNEPIYEQIVRQYKRLIMQDVLKENELLPSVRKLSYELSINPNTLQKAYSELEAKNICYSVAGKGRFVSSDAKNLIKKDKHKYIDLLEETVFNLAIYGVPYDEILGIVKKTFDKQTKPIMG